MTEAEINGEITEYGFRWGPMEVERLSEIRGRGYMLGIKAQGARLEIYVSPTGRSVRVYRGGEELGVAKHD